LTKLTIEKEKDLVRLELRRARARKYYQDNADKINKQRYGTKKRKTKKRRYRKKKLRFASVTVNWKNGNIDKYKILANQKTSLEISKFLGTIQREAWEAERESKRCTKCGRLPL
jgi:hypothetical protein